MYGQQSVINLLEQTKQDQLIRKCNFMCKRVNCNLLHGNRIKIICLWHDAFFNWEVLIYDSYCMLWYFMHFTCQYVPCWPVSSLKIFCQFTMSFFRFFPKALLLWYFSICIRYQSHFLDLGFYSCLWGASHFKSSHSYKLDNVEGSKQ